MGSAVYRPNISLWKMSKKPKLPWPCTINAGSLIIALSKMEIIKIILARKSYILKKIEIQMSIQNILI